MSNARAYDERVRGLASHFVWTKRPKESLTLLLMLDEPSLGLAPLFVQEIFRIISVLLSGSGRD